MATPPPSQPNSRKRKRRDSDNNHEEKNMFVSQNGDTDEEDSEEYDDELEIEGGYDEAVEGYPNEPIYDDEIPKLATRCVENATAVASIIIRDGCQTEAVMGLLAKAENLQTIPEIKSIVVAVIGPAGVGKSSTMNSLLGVPGIAKEGASGRAWTHVATNYCRPFDNQEQKLAAKVVYWSKSNIQTLIQEQLEHYMTFTFKKDKDWDQNLNEFYGGRSKTAFSTFRALFCERHEFRTPEAGEEYLAHNKENLSKAVSEMVGWCEKTLLEREDVYEEMSQYVEYYEADTAEELRASIDPVMTSKIQCTEIALWPLVEKVLVGIKGCRILEHCTISDLPGLTDTNQVRAKCSHDHLQKCDALLIVTDVVRVIDDQFVATMLERHAERFRDKLAVIVTRSDLGNLATIANDMADEGYSLENYPQLTLESQRIEKTLQQVDGSLRKLPDKRKQSERQKQRETQLQIRKQTLQAEKDAVEDKRLESLVRIRNAHVVNGLRAEREEHIPEGMLLPVFPVSNNHYAKCKGSQNFGGPYLSLAMTGIPDLRAHILRWPAPKLMRIFTRYVNRGYDIYMTGLDMWAAHSKQIKSTEDLHKIVDKPGDKIKTLLIAYLERTTAKAEKLLMTEMAKLQPTLVEESAQTVKIWSNYHWCTIRSFIANDGKSQEPKRKKKEEDPKPDWNLTLSKKAVDTVIKPGLKRMNKELSAELSGISREVEQVLDDMLDEIRGEPDAVSLPIDKFEKMVHKRFKDITEACDSHKDDCLKEMGVIRENACFDGPTSYFYLAMRDIYEDKKKDSGGGYKARVIQALETRITSPGDGSPFNVMAKSAATAVRTHAEQCTGTLLEELLGLVSEIVGTFHYMIDNRVQHDYELPVRDAIKAYLENIQVKLESIPCALVTIKEKQEYRQPAFKV